MQRPNHWLTDLDFEVCARQTHCGPSACVLVGWKNVELFAARPRDRPILYVGVGSFEWSSSSSHCLLGVLTPPLPAFYSNLALRQCNAQPHLIRVIALTEFAVRTGMPFLLASQNGVLSISRHMVALLVGYQAIMPVSVEDQK